MKKTKIANLDKESLYKMGDAMKIQRAQLNSVECQKNIIDDGLTYLESLNNEIGNLADETTRITEEMLLNIGNIGNVSDEELMVLNNILYEEDNVDEIVDQSRSYLINKIKTIQTGNDWDKYVETYIEYGKEFSVDTEHDPFSTLLSQREYEELQKEINDDFGKKTSIRNKTDLSFLAIATGLQVAKSLLFPLVGQRVGYGESFDKDLRLEHNDKSIVDEEKKTRNEYRDKKLAQNNEKAEWMEILYRTPPYDTTKGSPAINFNMEGKYHRIHTLGHDPVLGWIFGTANILTDTVTFDTFATYRVTRKPEIKITPERVSFISLFKETVEKSKEGKLNLPAALVAEKIHFKSDEFTKCGLPIPILETFTPEFAGKLYKNQYDALCFSRDLKVIGTSAAISMFIDMIIGLVHALYYDKEKDGSKDMFEARTRKILLISNTIATTSNGIYATVTQNPKNLDIGGLLVTVSHLFADTKFMLNVKREFIENRIYEKIEDEIKAIDENNDSLFNYGYNHNLSF